MPRRRVAEAGALRLEAIEGFGAGAEGARVRVCIGRVHADLAPGDARLLAERLVRLADAFKASGYAHFPPPASAPGAETDASWAAMSEALRIAAQKATDPSPNSSDDYAVRTNHEASFWYTHPGERDEMEAKVHEVFAETAKKRGVRFGSVVFDDLGPGETTALGAVVPPIPAGMPPGTRLLHGSTKVVEKAA